MLFSAVRSPHGDGARSIGTPIARTCDLFLCVGTSTVVEPAASLPFLALQSGARVIEEHEEREYYEPVSVDRRDLDDHLKDQIARLPEQPGVYLFANGAGETIYVGKARSLRDRVRSYLGARGSHPKTDALLDEADDRAERYAPDDDLFEVDQGHREHRESG